MIIIIIFNYLASFQTRLQGACTSKIKIIKHQAADLTIKTFPKNEFLLLKCSYWASEPEVVRQADPESAPSVNGQLQAPAAAPSYQESVSWPHSAPAAGDVVGQEDGATRRI